jgi:hypothetical protein
MLCEEERKEKVQESGAKSPNIPEEIPTMTNPI